MTIKQQGGIFGRNPTFNNVEVDGTLTANSVSTDQFNTPVDVNGTVTSNGFIVDTASTANLATYTYTSVDRSKIEGQQVGGAGGKLDFKTNDGGGLKSRVNIDHVGDVVFYKTDGTTAGMTYDASAFSLAFASGGGIDFSATSGTGTSELFDDYEEGTWTPSLSAYAGTPTTQGSYVKVGRLVKAGFKVILDGTSDTSNFRITGLPFSFGSDGGPDYGDGAVISYIDSGTTDIRFLCVGTTDIMAYNSSGTILSYNTVGTSTEVRGVVVYTAA